MALKIRSQKIQTNNYYYEIIAIAIELGVYWEMISFCLEFSLDELRHVAKI